MGRAAPLRTPLRRVSRDHAVGSTADCVQHRLHECTDHCERAALLRNKPADCGHERHSGTSKVPGLQLKRLFVKVDCTQQGCFDLRWECTDGRHHYHHRRHRPPPPLPPPPILSATSTAAATATTTVVTPAIDTPTIATPTIATSTIAAPAIAAPAIVSAIAAPMATDPSHAAVTLVPLFCGGGRQQGSRLVISAAAALPSFPPHRVESRTSGSSCLRLNLTNPEAEKQREIGLRTRISAVLQAQGGSRTPQLRRFDSATSHRVSVRQPPTDSLSCSTQTTRRRSSAAWRRVSMLSSVKLWRMEQTSTRNVLTMLCAVRRDRVTSSSQTHPTRAIAMQMVCEPTGDVREGMLLADFRRTRMRCARLTLVHVLVLRLYSRGICIHQPTVANGIRQRPRPRTPSRCL